MNRPKRTERGEYFSLGCAQAWDEMAKRRVTLVDIAYAYPDWGPSRVRRLLYGEVEPVAREVEALVSFGIRRDAWAKPPPKTWRFPHDREGEQAKPRGRKARAA